MDSHDQASDVFNPCSYSKDPGFNSQSDITCPDWGFAQFALAAQTEVWISPGQTSVPAPTRVGLELGLNNTSASFWALSAINFQKQKTICCAHLVFVAERGNCKLTSAWVWHRLGKNGFGQAPQTNPDLIFSGIFVAGLFQKEFHITSYAFYARCLCTVPHSQNNQMLS